jgi:FMN phosphatase YigB (HAD superfamily)
VKPAVVFDLGKVLVDFDFGIAAKKIAAHGTRPPAEIKSFIDQTPLLIDYESGRVTRLEFFERVRAASGFRGTIEEFGKFFAEIFLPIEPMIELHTELRRRGFQTFIFSNTNDLAIEHIRRDYPFFQNFDGYVLSYEVGAMKPQPEIYEAMEKMSGKRGAEIIYIDDRLENVKGGNARGWRAILHESSEKTRAVLEKLLPV